IAVRLYPVCCARRVTAPQHPLRTAAALPIHTSTATLNIAVSLPAPRLSGPGSIPSRLTLYILTKLSTAIPAKRRYPETIPSIAAFFEPLKRAEVCQRASELALVDLLPQGRLREGRLFRPVQES